MDDRTCRDCAHVGTADVGHLCQRGGRGCVPLVVCNSDDSAEHHVMLMPVGRGYYIVPIDCAPDCAGFMPREQKLDMAVEGWRHNRLFRA